MKKLILIAAACLAFVSCGTSSAEGENANAQDSTAVCATDSVKADTTKVAVKADSTEADTTKK